MSEITETMTPYQCAVALEVLLTETGRELMESERDYNRAKLGLDAKKRTGTDAQIATALAVMKTAEERYNNARKLLPEEVGAKFAAIRSALEKHIAAGEVVNPEAVDMATVELLKSGALTAEDMEYLARDALVKGNYTMLRMIVAEARRQYDAMADKAGTETERRKFLLVLGAAENTPNAKYRSALEGLGLVLRNGFKRGANYYNYQRENIESALATLRK